LCMHGLHAGTTRARTAHWKRKGRSAESVFVAAQGSFLVRSRPQACNGRKHIN
jgi:hypothetical protein